MFDHRELEQIKDLIREEMAENRRAVSRLEEGLIHVVGILKQITSLLVAQQSNRSINSFTITQEFPMLPIAPGFTPGFVATAVPAGSVPAPGSPVAWGSSDTVNAPVTVSPTDASGLHATVAIDPAATAGSTFTLTTTYTNVDGSTATGSATFTVVAAPSPDITSFTIAQDPSV